MSTCIAPEGEWELLVQADHDGELDAAQAVRVAAHLRACPHCAAWAAGLASLSAGMADLAGEGAPPAARRAMMAQIGRRRWRVPAGLAAGAALAAGLMLLLPRAPSPDPLIEAHLRAMQPGHLIEVESSDRHTVRPWFAGRLDFAPPVREVATLLGGRTDRVEGHDAAALVYRSGRHDIDLYIWPGDAVSAPVLRTARGFSVVAWGEAGMQMRAVSDMEGAELLDFVRAWRTAPER